MGHPRTDRINAGLVALGCALGCVLVLAASAGAVVVRLPNGHQAGVLFRGGADPALAKGSAIEPGRIAHARRPEAIPADDTCAIPDDGNVCWGGGPVLHTIDPYLIFWEPNVANLVGTTSIGLLRQYLTDVADDTSESGDTYGVGRQYFDASGFADQGQTFDAGRQTLVDSDAYPDGCVAEYPFSACITDDEIQSELATFIAAHDLPTGTGPGAPLYFVVTPEATDVCFDSAAQDGCSNPADPSQYDFCAYHANFEDPDAGESQVIYAPIPFSVETVGYKGCQDDGMDAAQYPNGDFADTIADTMSHESNESITEPIVNPEATGWEDTDAGSGQEIADNCESYAPTADPAKGSSPDAYLPTLGGDETPADPPTIYWGTLYDQLIDGGHYYTQSIWSNGQQGCETQANGGPLSAAFAAPGPALANTTITLNPSSTVAAAGVSSATWSFGDGATAFGVGALAGVSHTYRSPGRYQATLTVVDEDGQLSSVSHAVVIGTAPKAAFTESPRAAATGRKLTFSAAGSRDPNAGGSIVAYSWSFGDGATGAGVAPTHSYNHSGTYPVKLAVTDSLGFTGTETSPVTVGPAGQIKKLALRRSGTSELLAVTVSGPGTVRVGKRSKTLSAAGSASFKVGSAPKKRHKLKVKATVVYTPTFGPALRRTYSGVVFGR